MDATVHRLRRSRLVVICLRLAHFTLCLIVIASASTLQIVPIQASTLIVDQVCRSITDSFPDWRGKWEVSSGRIRVRFIVRRASTPANCARSSRICHRRSCSTRGSALSSLRCKRRPGRRLINIEEVPDKDGVVV